MFEDQENESANVFWPGYVDATTNLALNLLFLLTVMTSAVFMFALEMGRSTLDNASKAPQVMAQEAAKGPDQSEQIVALQLEIAQLKEQLEAKRQESTKKTHAASLTEASPGDGLKKYTAKDFEVIVQFQDDAIALSPEERRQVMKSLKQVAARGKSDILVLVPAGFTEARRMGFYRAMAIRNLLIEMNLPKDKISVSVVDGNNSANPATVMVK